jgi:hypothetical protein
VDAPLRQWQTDILYSVRMQGREAFIGSDEEYAVTGPAGTVAERARQKSLSHSNRSLEDDVLLAIDEAEAEEVSHTVAIKSYRRVPVEILERLLFFEAGLLQPQTETLMLATVHLILKHQL